MARKNIKTLPDDWEVAHEIQVNGRTLTRGAEVSIHGVRGRFRFLEYVMRPVRGIEWITVWGGPKGSEQLRSFRPEQIKTVHRIATTGRSLLEDRKAAKNGK